MVIKAPHFEYDHDIEGKGQHFRDPSTKKKANRGIDKIYPKMKTMLVEVAFAAVSADRTVITRRNVSDASGSTASTREGYTRGMIIQSIPGRGCDRDD